MDIEKQDFFFDDYIVFEIEGFENVFLENTKIIDFSDSVFRKVLINDKLSEATLYFDRNTNKDIKEITRHAHSVIFEIIIRLMLNREIDISSPKYKVKLIRVGEENHTDLTMNDQITFREEVRCTRCFESTDFLRDVLSGENMVNRSNELLYRKLFSIMKNPDRVVKYLVLYDFLMEIVSKNKSRKEQRNVSNFIKEQEFNVGINSIGFRQTRRIGASFKEDDFTYYRNELAHAEFENDLSKYELLSLSITNVLINKLIEVIHRAIQSLDAH